MKLAVFKFNYDVEYGGGLMLLAAKSENEAKEYANGVATGFGRWEYDGMIHGLTYETNKDGVTIIEAFTYAQ